MNRILLFKVLGLLWVSVFFIKSAYARLPEPKNTPEWLLQQIRQLNEMDRADVVACSQKAHQLLLEAKENGFNDASVGLYQLLGRIAHEQSHFDSAVYYFNEGIKVCTTTKGKHNLAVFYNNIAVVKHMRAQYQEAARYYQTAIRYARQYPPASMPIEKIYGNYGVVFTRLGLYEEAIVQLQKSLQVKNSPDSLAIVLGGLQSLGSVYKNQGKDSLATVYYDSAIAISRSTGYDKSLSILLNNLAELQLNRHQYALAQENLLEAEQLSASVNASYKMTIKANLGTTYLHLGQIGKAEAYLLNAYNSGLLIPTGQKDVTGQLSELYAAKKDFEKAYIFNRLYFKLQDSLQGEKIAMQVSELEKRYQSAEKDNELIKSKLLVSEQRHKLERKDLWILIMAVAGCFIIAVIITLVVWRNKRHKNRQAIERLKSVISGEEKERNRLAKDLHDGVNSTLNAIRIYIAASAGKEAAGISDPLIVKELDDMLDAATDDIRAVAYNLSPQELTQSGLTMSIRYFCSRLLQKIGINADIQIYEGMDETSPELALSIYRIIQELLQNIVKHSKASNMILLLYKSQEKIVLLVEDNGSGLPVVKEPSKSGGLGLSNIAERVAAHQGKLTIEAPADTPGLVVCIEFPVLS